MKKLFSFVCALVCAMSLNAAKTIYLNASFWESDGAVFMEGISNQDMTTVDGAYGYYQVSIEDSQTKVKFLRMKGDKSTQWNATNELTIPTDGNDCYTITGWGGEDGNWSKYTTPDPVDPSSVVYSIKHPWNGGNWEYKVLTPNEDGTYSIRDIYGEAGCNWKSTVSREEWIGSPTLEGNPVKGDSAIFTLTSTKNGGAITITKIASTGGEGGGTDPDVPTLPKVSLRGDMNNWNGDLFVAAADAITASVSVSLDANKTYKFKILEGDDWYGNDGTMNSTHHENWTFDKNQKADCKIETTYGGSYKFIWKYADKTLTVVYPSTPSALSNTEAENATVKVIRNGQVLIVREGVTYNMMGQVIQ